MLVVESPVSESTLYEERARRGQAARTQKLEDFKKLKNMIYSCNYII